MMKNETHANLTKKKKKKQKKKKKKKGSKKRGFSRNRRSPLDPRARDEPRVPPVPEDAVGDHGGVAGRGGKKEKKKRNMYISVKTVRKQCENSAKMVPKTVRKWYQKQCENNTNTVRKPYKNSATQYKKQHQNNTKTIQKRYSGQKSNFTYSQNPNWTPQKIQLHI
jgi:hypothetical protein